MRQISILNQSTVVSGSDLSVAVTALQQQLDRDFTPAWGLPAMLAAGGQTPERIYILDDSDQADALGYHTRDSGNAPVGFVFARTDLQVGEHWQATLSHELLEQLVDPYVNLAAEGLYRGRPATYALEVADAVENDEYAINGVPLSNFVLPTWFEQGFAGRVDFLGRLGSAFTLSPGGYISYQTRLGSWQQWFGDRTPHRQTWPTRYSRRQKRLARALSLAAD